MDIATATALRAIISGLRKSGAISDPHVTAVMRELEAAEPELKRWGAAEWIRYRRLCMDIAADAGVPTTIRVAEPMMDWGPRPVTPS